MIFSTYIGAMSLDIKLIKTTEEDLQSLFIFQTDEVSNQLAAFTPENPHDKEAYLKKWTGIVNNPGIDMQSIWLGEELVGSVIHFTIEEETNVSYWMNREHWGKGIASRALKAFIAQSDKELLHARVAFDNTRSQKVLENCGFQRIGKERGYANARQAEIEEFIYRFPE